MKTNARMVLTSLFLLFFVMGCTDSNPVALDETMEEEMTLGKLDVLEDPIHYAEGKVWFTGDELSAPLPGEIGKVVFYARQVNKEKKTGYGFFKYKEFADKGLFFWAKIKHFKLAGDEHAAYFWGPVKRGLDLTASKTWVYVHVEDGGDSGDYVRYFLGPPGEMEPGKADTYPWIDLNIARGTVTCSTL